MLVCQSHWDKRVCSWWKKWVCWATLPLDHLINADASFPAQYSDCWVPQLLPSPLQTSPVWFILTDTEKVVSVDSNQFNERSDLFIILHSHTSVITQKQLQEWEQHYFTAAIQAWSQARGPRPARGLVESSNSRVSVGSFLIFSIRHNFCLERGLCVLAGSVVWHMVRLICQRLLCVLLPCDRELLMLLFIMFFVLTRCVINTHHRRHQASGDERCFVTLNPSFITEGGGIMSS